MAHEVAPFRDSWLRPRALMAICDEVLGANSWWRAEPCKIMPKEKAPLYAMFLTHNSLGFVSCFEIL
jgi:hypothetical protein